MNLKRRANQLKVPLLKSKMKTTPQNGSQLSHSHALCNDFTSQYKLKKANYLLPWNQLLLPHPPQPPPEKTHKIHDHSCLPTSGNNVHNPIATLVLAQCLMPPLTLLEIWGSPSYILLPPDGESTVDLALWEERGHGVQHASIIRAVQAMGCRHSGGP